MKTLHINSIDASIGDEIDVTVYFYYQKEEKEEYGYPGCASEIVIDGVFIDDNGEKNIEYVLKDIVIEHLQRLCREELVQQAEEYEA